MIALKWAARTILVLIMTVGLVAMFCAYGFPIGISILMMLGCLAVSGIIFGLCYLAA